MKIKCLSGFRGEDGEIWNEGEIHECSTPMARLHIASNQAVPVDDLPPAPPLTTTGEREVVETRDPRVKRR